MTSHKKVPLDVIIDSLLHESSIAPQDSINLKWEWTHYCKLEELVSKIRAREASRDATDLCINGLKFLNEEGCEEMDPDSQRRANKIPAFMEWLKMQGVESDKVKISYANKGSTVGLGLVTTAPLAAGEVVFSIPQKAMITSSVARESKIKLMVEKDPLLSGMQNVLLAVFLVYERFVNQNSEWKPYIDILPQTFETVLFFNKEEMTLLKQYSPSAFREALRMLRNVTRQYAYFHTKFRKATDSASRALKSVFTYNRYIWGVSAVTTRINNIPNPSPSEALILSLIPLWDICNHNDGEEICTDYNEGNRSLICYAGHEYEENVEFTIFYGKRSSVDFLVHTGFVPTNYRHEFYALELGIGANDPNYARKKAFLAKIGLECHNSFQLKPDHLLMADKLFIFVHIFLADNDTLAEIEKSDNTEVIEKPTSVCWKFLATRFTLLKRVVDNSLASALRIFASEEKSKQLSRITLTILQLLKNEQKVLEMLTYCSQTELQQSMAK